MIDPPEFGLRLKPSLRLAGFIYELSVRSRKKRLAPTLRAYPTSYVLDMN